MKKGDLVRINLPDTDFHGLTGLVVAGPDPKKDMYRVQIKLFLDPHGEPQRQAWIGYMEVIPNEP